MDQTDHLSQYTTSKFITKATKLMLLSVSLFSILFFYSSSWYSFFLQLLNHALNKNCIFLICNGILVFLVKSSSFFINFSPENNLSDVLLFTTIGDHGKGSPSSLDTNFSLLERVVSPQEEAAAAAEEALLLDTKVLLLEKEVSLREEEEEEEEEEDSSLEMGKSEDSNLIEEQECDRFDIQHILLCTLHNGFSQSEEEEENALWNIGLGIEEEQEEGGGGENGLEISREELNKKCDEFIRRMKEEIRIGAQNYY